MTTNDQADLLRALADKLRNNQLDAYTKGFYADWLEEQAQALGGESLNSEVPSGSSPQQEKPDDRPRCPYCGQPHSKFGFYTANKKNDD